MPIPNAPDVPNEVTLDHIRRAAEWAKAAQAVDDPLPIDNRGHIRRYEQSTWDCGTACCIWGAAWILAGNEPQDCWAPDFEWTEQSDLHWTLAAFLGDSSTTPDMVLDLLSNGDTRP